MNEPEPHTAELSLVPAAPATFLEHATVIDDTSDWIAWAAAKEAWLESKRRRSGAENTVHAYTIAVKQFFRWAGIPPWKVHPGHAQEWAIYLSTVANDGEPLADNTVSLKLAALSSFYDFVQKRYTVLGEDDEHWTLWPADRANPFATVERPKISPYGHAIYPTTDELRAILAEINTNHTLGKRDFALLYALATTCRRASEILNLRWGDIQKNNDGDFTFKYRYKGGDQRRAVLNRMAYQAIVAYLEADDRPPGHIQPDDYIFIPLDPTRIKRLPFHADRDIDPNQPISNHQANAILKKYARRCGIDESKAHLHALRHAGARLRVEQMKDRTGGVDYMELMQLLGHSSLAVTQIYSQNLLEDPEDPGGDAAADALIPKGPRRRRRKPPADQPPLEGLNG